MAEAEINPWQKDFAKYLNNVVHPGARVTPVMLRRLNLFNNEKKNTAGFAMLPRLAAVADIPENKVKDAWRDFKLGVTEVEAPGTRKWIDKDEDTNSRTFNGSPGYDTIKDAFISGAWPIPPGSSAVPNGGAAMSGKKYKGVDHFIIKQKGSPSIANRLFIRVQGDTATVLQAGGHDPTFGAHIGYDDSYHYGQHADQYVDSGHTESVYMPGGEQYVGGYNGNGYEHGGYQMVAQEQTLGYAGAHSLDPAFMMMFPVAIVLGLMICCVFAAMSCIFGAAFGYSVSHYTQQQTRRKPAYKAVLEEEV